MAKIGDQYIITIDGEMKDNKGENLYTASGMHTLVFDDNGLSKLIPYKTNMHYIQEDLSYLKGMEEMKRIIIKLMMTSEEILKKHFGTDVIYVIIKTHTPRALSEKLKECDVENEKKKKFDKLVEEIGIINIRKYLEAIE